MTTRTLYYGDNLEILREHVADRSVDLVYLDPPFNSDQSYNVLFKERDTRPSQAQIEAFEDTWHWTPETQHQFELLMTDSKVPRELAKGLDAFRIMLGRSLLAGGGRVQYLQDWAEAHRLFHGEGWLDCSGRRRTAMTLVMSRTPSPRCTRQPLWLVAAGVFVLAAAACTGGANVTTTTSPATEGGGEEVSTTEADATVTLGAETCSSTIPETWVKREMIIELVADTGFLHFAAGTYREGHSRAELLALGTRLSAAPPVFVRLHYHEIITSTRTWAAQRSFASNSTSQGGIGWSVSMTATSTSSSRTSSSKADSGSGYQPFRAKPLMSRQRFRGSEEGRIFSWFSSARLKTPPCVRRVAARPRGRRPHISALVRVSGERAGWS